jgi:hypothetical protein
MRLENMIATLIKEGKVTKDPAREKQWIGANVVGTMSKAILTEALECGTLSWDVTICRALSIVLISATSSRSGDVVKSHYYDEVICMRFEHVIIKLKKVDGHERLVAQFEIAYEKGHK